jgi:hypothetical protein
VIDDMTRVSGNRLIVIGGVLLLLSMGTFAYGRIARWEHQVEYRDSAPPAEALPETLTVPVPAERSQTGNLAQP